MGYYTDYVGKISGISSEEEAQFTEDFKGSCDGYNIKLVYDYGDGKTWATFEQYGIKWYTHQEDLMKLSKKYPHILIELDGVGEERGDYWKKRFINGECETIEGIITYPDFKELTDEKVKKIQEEKRLSTLPQFIRHKNK